MKHFLKCFVGYVIISYLFVSFVETNINFVQWNFHARMIYVILCFMFAVYYFVFYGKTN